MEPTSVCKMAIVFTVRKDLTVLVGMIRQHCFLGIMQSTRLMKKVDTLSSHASQVLPGALAAKWAHVQMVGRDARALLASMDIIRLTMASVPSAKVRTLGQLSQHLFVQHWS